MLHIRTILLTTALLAGCNTLPTQNASQAAAKLDACVAKTFAINEGDWNYTGSIAFADGKFGTFRTRMNFKADGQNAWIATPIGGDAEGRSPSHVTYLGEGVIEYTEMTEGVEPSRETYTSCDGPDAQGRYTTVSTYDFTPQSTGQETTVTTNGVTSEHGSYFTETFDAKDGSGIVGYRSGVVVPSGN